MEKARWRIRICLLIVVLAAVLVGTVYYWQNIRSSEISEGVLITIMGEIPEGQWENGTE